MPFPWTLQRYIFREMGKTFVMTAIALTGVVGLGGGVLNMVRLGEVTPAQLGRMMALLLPLAAGLTLPIAALFSAAATYGRLSADNEFVACRSSGINMHILFLPTVVVSLVAAGLSFGLTNYMIPGMVRNLDKLITSDVGSFIRQRLNRPRGITLGGKYRVHADTCEVDPSDPNRITLHHIAFVELERGEWARFGTARQVDLVFDRSETRVRVDGAMRGLSFYDREQGQFCEVAEQRIGSSEIRSPLPQKTKFLKLNELIHYFRRPHEWHEAAKELERVRRAEGRLMVCDAVWKDWQDDGVITLADDDSRYTLRADEAGRIPEGRGIELTNAAIEESRPGRRCLITAQRAVIEVTRADTMAESGVEIDVYDARLVSGGAVIERAKDTLGPVAIDADIVERVEALDAAELLEPGVMDDKDPLAHVRTRARETRDETYRRVVGTMSERTAFSVSVFVLVILAAALGIIFRGAHMMMAFGISFVPMLFVIIMIVTGKQMSHNAATHGLGLAVMWGGIVAVAGLDVWTLTRVLRR